MNRQYLKMLHDYWLAVVMFIAYEIGSVEKSGMEIAVKAGLQQCYEPNNRTALWKRECNVQ